MVRRDNVGLSTSNQQFKTMKKVICMMLFAMFSFLAFSGNPNPPPKEKISQGIEKINYAFPASFQFTATIFEVAVEKQKNPKRVNRNPRKIKAVNMPPLRKSEGRLCNYSNFKVAKVKTYSTTNADFKVGWQKLQVANIRQFTTYTARPTHAEGRKIRAKKLRLKSENRLA
jgi:hypothetical protein